MSYRPNQSQQLSIFDRSLRLTERERKCLEKSWAKVFSDEIFPAIDEDRFRVLYSETASRPNTPVNVIVGALIIKELFDLSDDEVVENLMLDVHYQYALHTTSYEEQPLSDKTLSRFRRRCYEYERLNGVDLFHDCVCDLSGKIAKMMGISSRIKRMDSLMVEANIRNLSRIELLYTCVARLVQYHHKNQTGADLAGLEHYLPLIDRNRVIYHSRHVDIEVRTTEIVRDAEKLLGQCQNQDACSDIEAYQLLLRCIEEQTISENGIRRLRNKRYRIPHERHPFRTQQIRKRLTAGKSESNILDMLQISWKLSEPMVPSLWTTNMSKIPIQTPAPHGSLEATPSTERRIIHCCRRCIFRSEPPGCRIGEECTAYQHKPQGDFGPEHLCRF